MADKESAHETIGNGHHHQQAGYQMPSLTSKPLKQAQVLKDTTNQTEPEAPSGYYFNVAQKGKLILPTALWILLILAGISFLTLLASLNRTVDTLDTLIELEQEKAALGSFHRTVHHHEHHEQDKKPPTGKHTGQEHHHDEKNWPDSDETSWLALPSWTSLEPVPREDSKPAAHRRHDNTAGQVQAVSSSSADDQLSMLPPEIQSAIDNLLGPADQLDGKNSIVSGSFMFSSAPPQGADAQQPDDMLDSIMKQMMPMLFPGSKLSKNNKISNQELAAKQRNHDSDEAKSAAGSLLSANIENLNINVNISGAGLAQSGDTEKGSGADRKRRPATIEREESDELEQSLDNMISKLIGHSKLINEPNKPIVMDLGGLQAAARPLEMIKIGGSLSADNIHHQHQKSPLSSFMMPIGFGSLLTPNQQTESPLTGPESLFAPQEHRRPHHHHHQATPDQMIISIASDEPLSNGPLSDFASIFANSALKDASALQFPSLKTKHQQLKPTSPYELPVGSPMSALLDSIMDPDESASKSSGNNRPSFNKSPKDETQRLKDEAKWDVLANDLADSLMSSLLPQQQFGGETPGLLSTPANMPIYSANWKPLDESERQKFPSILAILPEAEPTTQTLQSTSTNKQDGDFDISNLFSLLFGKREPEPTASSPPPPSSTMSPDQTTASPSSTYDSTSTEAVLKEMADMLGESLSTTVADGAKASSQTAQTKETLGDLVNANIMPTTASSTSATDKKDAKATTEELGDDIVSGLMSVSDVFGKMLTMPQFGNDQPQRSTSDSSSGGSSGGSSSSGSNSLRETMLCNCQKVSSNSTSSRQQSGNSNTSFNRAGNSGSSGGGGSSNRGWSSSSSNGTGGGGGGSWSSGGSSSSNGGGGSGNRAGSSSSAGGDRDSSNRRNGPLDPIGYVPYSGRPENAPSAFAVGSLMAEPARHRQSSSYQQESSESGPAEPVTNAQPGSLLSALNNSPNQLLPRIIERLNNTSVSSLNLNSNDSYPILVTPLL